jgi:hypothetical protein
VLPAVLSAAQQRRPFAACWLSEGAGAPLSLISNAAGRYGPQFPPGARGSEVGDDWLHRADRLVWSRCSMRQAVPSPRPLEDGPSLFESTLVNLMDRPFGWLVLADQCDERVIDAEIKDLQYDLRMLRRPGDDQVKFKVERAERRMAELDAFRGGALERPGTGRCRVPAGAGADRPGPGRLDGDRPPPVPAACRAAGDAPAGGGR